MDSGRGSASTRLRCANSAEPVAALDEKQRSAWEAGAWSIRVDALSTGAAIGVGAVAGLVLGILVSVATDLPLAPEVGLLLGALGGWLFGRKAS